MYNTLPADRQEALRDEALANLLQQGLKSDFITSPLVLYEIRTLLAAQGGPAPPVAPSASADAALSPTTVPARPIPRAQGRLPAPTLSHLIIEDLRETSRLLILYARARQQGLIGARDPDRLTFVAMAEHALRVGDDNPCGLFATLLHHEQLRSYLTDADDAAAQTRLKTYAAPQEHRKPCTVIDLQQRQPPSLPASPLPPLSEDAQMVRALRREWEGLGHRGEAFAYVHYHDATWTRDRWDTALLELAKYESDLRQGTQAWRQTRTLHRLTDLETLGDWLAADDPQAGERCPECGEECEACVCPPADDAE